MLERVLGRFSLPVLLMELGVADDDASRTLGETEREVRRQWLCVVRATLDETARRLASDRLLGSPAPPSRGDHDVERFVAGIVREHSESGFHLDRALASADDDRRPPNGDTPPKDLVLLTMRALLNAETEDYEPGATG